MFQLNYSFIDINMTNIGRIRTVVLGSSRVGKSGKIFEFNLIINS
jgi:hypothetical protein